MELELERKRHGIRIHEAGHAVSACVLGIRFACVTTDQRQLLRLAVKEAKWRKVTTSDVEIFVWSLLAGVSGAIYRHGEPWRSRTALRRCMVESACGPLAERRALGPAYDGKGASGDHAEIEAALEKLAGGNVAKSDRLRREAYDHAERLVARHWKAIVQVANELESHGTVYRHDVRRIVAAFDSRSGSPVHSS